MFNFSILICILIFQGAHVEKSIAWKEDFSEVTNFGEIFANFTVKRSTLTIDVSQLLHCKVPDKGEMKKYRKI